MTDFIPLDSKVSEYPGECGMDLAAIIAEDFGTLALCADGYDELTPSGYADVLEKTDEARAMLRLLRDALKIAQPILRAVLDGLVSSNTAWTMAALGKYGDAETRIAECVECITAAITSDRGAEELADQVKPLLHAIRTAEALVGRETRDGESAWLNAVIDGGAGI